MAAICFYRECVWIFACGIGKLFEGLIRKTFTRQKSPRLRGAGLAGWAPRQACTSTPHLHPAPRQARMRQAPLDFGPILFPIVMIIDSQLYHGCYLCSDYSLGYALSCSRVILVQIKVSSFSTFVPCGLTFVTNDPNTRQM